MKYQAKSNTPNWENWHEVGCEFVRHDEGVCDCDKKRKQLISKLLSQQEQEVKEETLSCRLLWERLGEWNKEWQAENPKERKLHFNDSLKLIEWKMGKTKQEAKKETANKILQALKKQAEPYNNPRWHNELSVYVIEKVIKQFLTK